MSQSRVRIVVGVVAAVCGTISALLPLSYDEAYWLGIWRMWSSGDSLYVTAIDNKSPLVYLVYGLLDAVPGSFQLVRGIFVGLFLYLVGSFARSAQENRQPTPFLVGTLLVVIALLTEFKLYTELMAAPLVVAALGKARNGEVGFAALLAVVAAALTPLAAGAIIVVAVLGWSGFRRTVAAVLPALTLAVVIVSIVFVVDDLRFGLVEMNFASRQSLGSLTAAGTAERPFITAMTAMPLVLYGYVRSWGRRSWAVMVVLCMPPILAGAYLHYWIVPAAAALQIEPGRQAKLGNRSERLVLWAAAPLVIISVLLLVDYTATANAYRRVTERLEALDDEEWDFVQFDLQPYVTMRFPERALLRSPSINYLVWETSRSESHRSEVPRLLGEAEILLEPGLEGDLDIPDSVAHLVPTYMDAIRGFDCSFAIEHLTIHFRQSLCDDWRAAQT